jgi:beta-lactamase regulating signal transducer with metallopeptidase domain
MELLVHNLSEVFAVSIIHSVWQCLLIYLMLRILLSDSFKLSAAAKHNVAFGGMLLSALWFFYTLFNEAGNYTWHLTANTPITYQHLPLINAIKNAAGYNDHYTITIERYLPFISIVYAAGLLFNSMKLTMAWLQTRQIRKQGKRDSLWQRRLNELSQQLNIKKLASILLTDSINVPCITGYLKPVVLMPLALTTYLSVKEIEAILLHELAHLKRNDYLINLLQQIVTVILFFNPFILLMNRIVSSERENSCDDLVVDHTGSPLVYAQALLKIQENNVEQWSLALAATGKKFHLLNRIERIMKTKKPQANIRQLVMALAILIVSASCMAWFNPAIGHGKISIRKIKPVLQNLFTDTTKKSHPTAKTSEDHLTRKHRSAKVHRSEEHSRDEYLNDAELQKLSAEVGKYSEQISKYFQTPEFRKNQEQMQKMGQDMQFYYNSDQMKSLQAEAEKMGRDIQQQWGNNEENEKITRRMATLGKTIEGYYSSKEFKDLNHRLEKKYGIPQDRVYGKDGEKDENYRKYEEELRQHTPAEVKAATEEMGKLGDQMKARYDTPEFKEATAKIKLMGDSLRNVYENNPQIKQEQEEMRKMGEHMKVYTNSPELKKLQKQMQAAEAKLRAYTNSPAFKNRMKELEKNAKEFQKDEAPEQPEKPEKPEQPEKPESDVKP